MTRWPTLSLGAVAGWLLVIQPASGGETTPAALARVLTMAADQGALDRVSPGWLARSRRAAADPVALFALATLARLRYDSTQTDARYRALYTDRATDRWAVHAMVGHGIALGERGRVRPGSELLARAAQAGELIGDSAAVVQALAGRAGMLVRLGQPDSVPVVLARMVAWLPHGDTTLAILAACGEAGAIRGSRPARADSLARYGITLARLTRDRRLEGRCLTVRASAANLLGRPVGFRVLLDSARAALDSTADLDAQAVAYQLSAFANVTYSYALGDVRRYAGLAIETARRCGNRLVEAWAHLNLAQLALRIGDLLEAARSIARSRAIMVVVGDRTGELAASLVAADAAFAGGGLAQADTLYRSVLASYSQLGWESARITPLLRLSALAIETHQPDLARRRLDDAIAASRRAGAIGVETDRHYFDGLIALGRGDWDAAARSFRIFTDSVRRSFHYRFDADLRRAEAFARAGRVEQAITALDSALAMPDRIRSDISSEGRLNRDLVVAVLADRQYEFDPDLGFATTIALLIRNDRTAAAFRFAEAQRARLLLGQMIRRSTLARDSAEGRRLGRSRLVAGSLSADDIRAKLDRSTALVSYLTGRGGEPTTVFVVTASGLRATELAPADSVVGLVDRFVGGLEAGSTGRALARRLGQELFDPVLAGLPATVNRLVVIPDGPFHRLPFDALAMEDGRLLIERFAVSVAPSARLAGQWLSEPDRAAGRKVVAFGDPSFDPAAGVPRLPGSGREASLLGRLGAPAVIYTRGNASEKAFKRETWEGTAVLHLATHAVVEEWGILSSALYLAPGGGEDGRLGPEDIIDQGFPVELVVLSACRTAGGVVVFGEGIQGLTAPFLESGARSVVATQWAIGDRAVVSLMERFYREIGRGATVGEALHAAKLEGLRRGNGSAWASLSLTGSPNARPLPAAPNQ